MIELISREELLLSGSIPFAIEGAETFGWRLSVNCIHPVPWIPREVSSEPVSSAILRFSDGSKLIISTRTTKPLNETTSLHFESRQHSSALEAQQCADIFRKKLILLDAVNHLGLEIIPSDDAMKGPSDADGEPAVPSQIDQICGDASDSFCFPESIGVKGMCSDFRLKAPTINSNELHSALDALVRQSIEIDKKFSVALDLLRAAGKERSLRGRFLLTFAAFEAICIVQDRTEVERSLINRLDSIIQDANLPAEKKSSLRSALGNLKRQPLRDAMLARVNSAAPRAQIKKESASALVKSAVRLRNSVAHPAHSRLPEDLAKVSDQLHFLILKLILVDSNEQALDIPFVHEEQSFELLQGAIICPLNAAEIWYSH